MVHSSQIACYSVTLQHKFNSIMTIEVARDENVKVLSVLWGDINSVLHRIRTITEVSLLSEPLMFLS